MILLLDAGFSQCVADGTKVMQCKHSTAPRYNTTQRTLDNCRSWSVNMSWIWKVVSYSWCVITSHQFFKIRIQIDWLTTVWPHRLTLFILVWLDHCGRRGRRKRDLSRNFQVQYVMVLWQSMSQHYCKYSTGIQTVGFEIDDWIASVSLRIDMLHTMHLVGGQWLCS